ncbi:Exocyst complex component EXO70H1 [Linum perenne]
MNSAFEEAYKKQSSWVVPDSKLRDEIKISLARNVGPVYRRFYEKYRTAVAREFGGVVRYAPDDLDNHWSDLFYGKVERFNELFFLRKVVGFFQLESLGRLELNLSLF